MLKRTLIPIFIVLCCSSCTGNSSLQQKEPLRLLHFGQDPKTFNPWISDDSSSSYYSSLMFASFFETDPDTDELKPGMAETYKLSENTITVCLRKDLEWSDGHQINTDDVIFTFNELLKNKIANSSLRDILLIDGVFPELIKLDEHCIEFSTHKTFAPFLKSINIPIAPKHDVAAFFRKKAAQSLEEKQKIFNSYLSIFSKPEEIVVSGPYKLKRLIPGEAIIMTKNPKFFRKNDQGKNLPYLEEIIYSYVQDSNSEIFKFLAGESQIANISPQNGAFMKNLEEKYKFTLYDLGASTGTNFIWFNLSNAVPEPQRTWFRDKNFRKAISYAIDRNSIINNVFQGLAEALFTAESLKSPFLNQKISQGHPFDISKSIELLKISGFELRDKKLFDKKGNRVEFSLFTNAGNLEREMMSSIIVNNLDKIGIKINFKPIEFNNFVSRISAGKSYEAGLLGLTGSNEPHHGANVWKSDGRLHLFHVRQKDEKAWDWELKIDELFEKGAEELDLKKRKLIYDEFQELVFEEMPLIYLVSPKSLVAASNELEGIRKTKYAGIIPKIYEVRFKSFKQ
jgi:peptide/nickel transport system substrate-binding protein